jgi:hypothetical protein
LFLRVGFIVTNLETDSRAVVRFYDSAELPTVPFQRGAAIADFDRARDPVATADSAQEDRQPVVDGFAAAVAEDRLLLAETHLTRRLFTRIVRRIAVLTGPALCCLTDKKLDKKGGGDGKDSEESLENGVGLRLAGTQGGDTSFVHYC